MEREEPGREMGYRVGRQGQQPVGLCRDRGVGWRKRPGQAVLQGPDKAACQRRAGEGKTSVAGPGRRPGRLPQAPENNGHLTPLGH